MLVLRFDCRNAWESISRECPLHHSSRGRATGIMKWAPRGTKLLTPEPASVTVGDAFQFRLAATAFAPHGFASNRLGLNRCACQPVRPASPQPRQPARIGQLGLAVRAHEPVVANLAKAGRKDVLRENADLGLSVKPPSLVGPFTRWLHAARHSFVVDRNDPIVADRNPIDVRCQVLQDRLAVADRLDVHHPVGLQHAWWQVIVVAGFTDRFR